MYFAIVIVSLFVFGVSEAYPVLEGTDCFLRNGAIGVCRPVKKCPGAIQTIKQKYGSQSANIRCGREGNVEIICCARSSNDDSIIFRPWDDESPPPVRPTKRTTTRRPTTTSAPVAISNRIAAQECSKYKAQSPKVIALHITDGDQAEEGEFPHLAALGYRDEEGNLFFDCGGTLISDKFIVTAAHCIRNKRRITPYMVRMGTTKLEGKFDTSDTDYEIKNIIVHPEYKTTSKYHDIALLELTRSVKLSDNIYPACVYTEGDDPNLPFTIAGWGIVSGRISNKSEVLLKAKVDLHPKSKCVDEYRTRPNLANGIVEEQICAISLEKRSGAEDYRDTCEGDSGGPLEMFYNGMPTLVGITSFSQGSCGAGAAGVYLKVSKYLDWIEPQVWSTSNDPDDYSIRFE